MIITPQIYTPTHIEEVTRGADTEQVNEETLTKIIQNHNWSLDLRPIGTIIYHNINQQNALPPNPTVWQECDGSEITNPDSPLRSIGVLQNFVPNLQDTYLRVHNSLTGNPQGGTQAHNLRHTHSTSGRVNITPQTGLEDKGDRRKTDDHTHAVAQQYDNPNVLDAPAYVYYIAYMKVV